MGHFIQMFHPQSVHRFRSTSIHSGFAGQSCLTSSAPLVHCCAAASGATGPPRWRSHAPAGHLWSCWPQKRLVSGWINPDSQRILGPFPFKHPRGNDICSYMFIFRGRASFDLQIHDLRFPGTFLGAEIGHWIGSVWLSVVPWQSEEPRM